MQQTDRLQLSQVTLCAVTSINVSATLRALEASARQIAFGACKLLTDAEIDSTQGEIQVVKIERICSAADYSQFLLTELADHVETSHCLVAQWDGHVVDAKRWQPVFLDCDYIGASWPQFDNGHDVGNGGFSLRSRRLMNFCRDPDFVASHPEDIAIGRTNRNWLEAQGMRFADKDLADLFAAERSKDPRSCFGYHGVWNMPRAVGADEFWAIYKELDNFVALRRDFLTIFEAVRRGPDGYRRALRMLFDRYCQRLG